MAEYLVIRLGNDPASGVQWIVADDEGTRRGAPGAGLLAEAAVHAAEREVIALAPAASVLTTSVALPVRSGARMLAALPFALEEQLADDVESLHFAAGERDENGLVPAAAVSITKMEDWLSLMAGAGIKPRRIIAEQQGLATIPGTMSMLVEEEQILFNDGANTELALQGVTPAEIIEIAGAGAGNAETEGEERRLPRHLLVFCEPGTEELYADDWAQLRSALETVDVSTLADGSLPRLAVTAAAGHGTNLLQGRFADRNDLGALLRPWRYAAMLLVGLGLVLVAGKGVDYYRLGQDEAALKARFTQEYRQIRPDDSREVVDPVNIVNSLRRSLGGPVAAQVFLPSLQELGRALAQNRAAEIEAISYRAGVIDIRLTAPDVATLDNIQRLVSSSGRFTASIQSTDQVGDKISSRIQIREAGA